MTTLPANEETRPSRRPLPGALLAAVLLLAVGLRCACVLVQSRGTDGPELLAYADERDYWSMAASWMAGETMRDQDDNIAARMPGYPLFLTLWMSTGSPILLARLAQAVLAGCGCLIFVLIGRRVGGPALGLLAGLLTALDPFAVLFTNLLLSETLFTVTLGLFVLVTLSLSRRGDELAARGTPASGEEAPLWRWALWALSFLLCVYLHPSVVLLLPVSGLGLLLRRRTWRNLGGFGVALVVLIAGVAPWAVRNQRLLGGPCLLTSRLGISLYDGLGPRATGRSDLAYTRDLAEIQGLDELGRNRWFLARSLGHLRSDPARIMRLAWRKLLLTWNVVPNLEAQRTPAGMLVSACWMVPVLLLGAVGLLAWRAARGDKVLLLIPPLYFTLLHVVFVGSVRYRVPVMPYVEILAAAGLLFMFRRLRPNTRAPSGP